MPPGWPCGRQASDLDRFGGLHMRAQRHAAARKGSGHGADVALQDCAIEHQAGGGQISKIHAGGVQLAVVVDRQHGARHMPPGEARQDRAGQAGCIDLDDLIGAEELVEAAAEMAARFYHDDAGAAMSRPNASKNIGSAHW